MPTTIYFDYNATTPLDAAVRESMLPFLAHNYGNPSSIHHVGRRARAFLDDARDRLAALWKCRPAEIVFTSGGTEANNLAILGTARKYRDRGRHIITSAVEHHAVLHACQYLARHESFDLTLLPVDGDGRVDPADLKRCLCHDTVLVSVMAANNEIGTLQPIAELAAICHHHGVLFHTDAVQAFGKLPFHGLDSLHADLVAACAHKIHGPKGAGALFVRSGILPHPILLGGAHENERRAGTENLAAIAGWIEAAERFVQPPVFNATHLDPLLGKLEATLRQIPGVLIHTPSVHRLNNTLAFTTHGADSLSLLAGLDMEGVCASSGSACSAGSLEPSHVLLAMGLPRASASSLVRFSLGRESTDTEVTRVCDLLPHIIERSRRE